jgi:hypothetical protein|tara:strand:- start:1191 stop:2114 length:924 start_codon:yes stop_codon:yes gene_type:complete
MALFTFSVNGAPRAIDLLGLGTDQIEEAIKRLRGVFGADFQPVSLRGTTTPSSGSLKIGSGNQLSDRFGNVVSPQDFISGAITSSPKTDFGGNGGFAAMADGNLPTVGDLGPGAQTVTPAAFGGQLEQQAPFGAFSNYLGAYGLGSSDPRSAARTFAESQYNPLRSAFAGQQLLQPIQEGDPNQGNEFASFLAQGGINPRKRLGDAFRGLQSAAGQSTLDPGSIFADALDAQTGGEGGEAVDIFNLARQIQRSSYSPLISGRFTGQSNDELFNRFAAQRARAGTVGGGGQNTLDFARSQFGLGGLGF